MTQSDILDLLRDNPNKWFTVKVIARMLNTRESSVSNSMVCLRRFNIVNFRRTLDSKGHWRFHFKYKKN